MKIAIKVSLLQHVLGVFPIAGNAQYAAAHDSAVPIPELYESQFIATFCLID
ncbi:MAG: hypothetical protein ABSG96_02085 [Terracidiphilus sp.]|jgi:hypothetical protein